MEYKPHEEMQFEDEICTTNCYMVSFSDMSILFPEEYTAGRRRLIKTEPGHNLWIQFTEAFLNQSRRQMNISISSIVSKFQLYWMFCG